MPETLSQYINELLAIAGIRAKIENMIEFT
jgi:hypothetical protein